jgi:hypothetical protein
LLRASFGPHLTVTPLRFAITSPPSGCEEDLHLQAVEHARHTNVTPVLFQVARVERNSKTWAVGAWKLQCEEPWSDGYTESVDPTYKFD